jgi:fumarate reductase subunit C
MQPANIADGASDTRRQLVYELISGGSGLVLALFMWGHMLLVGSMLTGERGFNWMASMLEDYYIAQPTVVIILLLFLSHAALASRKIPAQIAERKAMLKLARNLRPHEESLLWIWQVRTGMVVLVLGSFHIILLGLDVFTPLFGERDGIEAVTSLARVQAGLWLPYAVLLISLRGIQGTYRGCRGIRA